METMDFCKYITHLSITYNLAYIIDTNESSNPMTSDDKVKKRNGNNGFVYINLALQ